MLKRATPLLTVWASLLLFSFVHAPIPSVNEPHYLTKARHFWASDWCAGDFFLESSSPHMVFYLTLGAFTVPFSLPAATLIARLIAYFILAFGWHRLAVTLTDDLWAGVKSLWLFLLFAAIGNLSGEWLCGGVEGKVPAYGFALWSLSAISQRRWITAGVALGLSIAFHPLVGGWCAVSLSMVAVLSLLKNATWGRSSSKTASPQDESTINSSSTWQSKTAGLGLLIAVSMFGIVPALNVVGGESAQETYAANYLQVFYRLSHHLDPMQFHSKAWRIYGVMALACVILCWPLRKRTGFRLLSSLVLASMVIALAGLVIAWGERPLGDVKQIPWFKLRLALLKFYPFRLFDVALPILLAMSLADYLSARRLPRALLPRGAMVTVFVVICGTSLWLAAGRGSVNRMPAERLADWLDACEWVREEAPKDVLVHTPRESRYFKWYAQRAEYVAVKNCPQDAAGVVEWNRRLQFINRWGKQNWNDAAIPVDGSGQSRRAGYSREVTHRLHEETGITHIISRRFGPFDAPVVYRNRTWRVYRIDQLDLQ